jgi:Mrp family chromosome partitioning ATPase
MQFTDTQILAAGADATLLVLRMNQSMRQIGMLALDALQKVGANVQGAVANDVAGPRRIHKYGGAWQYASRGRQFLATERAPDSSSAALPAAKSHKETLMISEPAWSSDTGVAKS